MVRGLTATITGMATGDIKAIPAEIGGGFGGKTIIYLEPVAMVLSKKCGRPVKMQNSREEVFQSTGPAAGMSSSRSGHDWWLCHGKRTSPMPGARQRLAERPRSRQNRRTQPTARGGAQNGKRASEFCASDGMYVQLT